MDVPLTLNNIRIRQGLMGFIRKSSTFNQKDDVVGLSVFLFKYQKDKDMRKKKKLR